MGGGRGRERKGEEGRGRRKEEREREREVSENVEYFKKNVKFLGSLFFAPNAHKKKKKIQHALNFKFVSPSNDFVSTYACPQPPPFVVAPHNNNKSAGNFSPDITLTISPTRKFFHGTT